MRNSDTVTRAAFIKRFMDECGLTYVQACHIYDCMVTVLEDAVVSGGKVNFGRLGCLTPVLMQPRMVTMGFERTADNEVTKRHRTYFLGRRLNYRFKLYREFVKKHALNWFQ
jgi:nucleoid DNA-binding protein